MATEKNLAGSVSATGAVSAPPDVELAAELTALEVAYARLGVRDMASAEALLTPYAETSTQVATLVVMARIRMARGDFESAHRLLTRGESLYPFDRTVWETTAELLMLQRRYVEEVVYRRKLAYTDAVPPARAHLAIIRAFVAAAQSGTPVPLSELRIASKKIVDAPGFTDDMQIRFAEALYAVKKMVEDARAHYATARPCPPTHRDIRARWVDMPEWCEQVGAPLRRWESEVDDQEVPMLADLERVWVHPDFQWVPLVDEGQVMLKGLFVSRMLTARENPASPVLMHNARTAELRLPREVTVVETPALLIGGSANYYQHTIEYASRLAIVEALRVGADLPLVVNDDLEPFQLEHFAMLGYPKERLIPVGRDRLTCFTHLMVPTLLAAGPRRISPKVADWYRQRLGQPSRKAGRRLYLSTPDHSGRRLLDEPALIKLLGDQGYEVINAEALGLAEQIRVFAEASHIVAPSCPALTNIVYAPAGARIFCLHGQAAAAIEADVMYDALATACGHRFSLIKGALVEDAHDDDGVAGRRFAIDFDVLRTLMRD